MYLTNHDAFYERERERVLDPSKKFYLGLRSIFVCLFFVGGFFVFADSANATTYYVDPDITDTNVSSATPDFTTYNPTTYETTGGADSVYKTIADVNKKTFSAGDNIFFKKGSTFSGTTLIPKGSGSSGNVITWSSFGSGSNPLISNSSLSGIRIDGLSYLTIDGIDVVASGSNGIFLYIAGASTGVSYVTIQNLTVGPTSDGITFFNSTSHNNITVQNVTVTGATTNGINAIAQGMDIVDSSFINGLVGIRISGNTSYATSTDVTIDGVTVDGNSSVGLVISKVDGLTVNDTLIQNNTSYGVQISNPVGIGDNITFTNTTISNNGGATLDGLQVVSALGNLTIQDSVFTNNGRAGVSVDNVVANFTFDNSTSTNNDVYGLSIGGAASSTISNSNLSYNGGTGLNIGYGTTTVSYVTAEENQQDGFSVNGSAYVVCDHCSAIHNGDFDSVEDVAGDGYSWHGNSTGIIRYSLSRNNEKSGFAHVNSASVQAYYNVIDHDTNGQIALVFLQGLEYDIYNNTIVTKGASAESDSTTLYAGLSGTSLIANNNLINSYDTGIYVDDVAGVSTDYNLVYAGNTNYSGLSQPAHDLASVSPLFNSLASSDYTLNYLSPAIDAGTNMGLTTDYAGHPIYGTPDIGAYEYQPPFTIGTDDLDVTGDIRIYGDGKYRYTTATSSTMSANFSVVPPEGTWTYSASTTRPEWLNISDITWNTSGTYSKQWTASSTSATTTVYTIGDLLPSTQYTVKVDSATSTDITGDSCTASICESDGDGQIVFTYSGGYSAHDFNIDPASIPTLTTNFASAISATAATANGTIDAIGDDSPITRGFLYSTDSTLAIVIATTTETGTFGTGSFTASLSGFTCGNTYYIRSYATNSGGTGYGSIVSFNTNACPSSSSGSRSIYYVPPVQNTATTTIATSTRPIITTTFSRDLELGMTGDDVKELQRLLNSQGFTIAHSGFGSLGNETNTFGSLTKQALIRFQISHNIVPAIGYFGPLTRAFVNGTQASSTTSISTITSSFTRNLAYGSTGEDVKQLQIFLNTHGYAVFTSGPGSQGNETTLFGRATESALIKFQIAQSISPAVGFFGPVTRKVVEGMK